MSDGSTLIRASGFLLIRVGRRTGPVEARRRPSGAARTRRSGRPRLFFDGACRGLRLRRESVAPRHRSLSGQEHRLVTALDRVESEDAACLGEGVDAVLDIACENYGLVLRIRWPNIRPGKFEFGMAHPVLVDAVDKSLDPAHQWAVSS